MTPVVIAFTPNYFIPATVLIHSTISHSKETFEFICLVSEDIPDKQKSEMDRLVGNKASFRYLTISKLEEGVYIDPRYSAAAEFRLLLPELLPEYEKVIYIDCDIVVRNDLGDLYNNIQLDDKLLAAVFEAPIEGQAQRWKALGCDSERYFNSGFLVMNLSQMRKEKTSKKLIGALKTDYLEFPDQDVLNIVCQGRVSALPPFWNSIRTFFLPQYKADFLKQYTEEDWSQVHSHGTVHYTGGKPWNVFTVQFDKWWREYYELPVSIRDMWKPSLRIKVLAPIYLSSVGKWGIEQIRAIYRRIKL